MNRYFIQLSFDGTNYHGWQIQQNAHTVQKELNDALSAILKEQVLTIGCGRTDTGVHAKIFYAHFDSIYDLSNGLKSDKNPLVNQLNQFLPDDIAIKSIFKVQPDSHARFYAISRTYQYNINQKKNAFLINKSYYFYGNLDIDEMNKAASILYEYKDFSCFSKSKTQVKTNLCQISNAEWRQEKDSLVFTITSDRFLRNMVRAIMGTLLEIGQRKMTINEFRKVIESKNRSNAGMSVPAYGLYLIDVQYPEKIRTNAAKLQANG